MKKNTLTNCKKLLAAQNLRLGLTNKRNEVLERIDQLSIEYAKELQAETGVRYEKICYMGVPSPSSVGHELDP